MPFSVHSGVCLVFLTTLLSLPEQGCPQCYRPKFRTMGHVAPPCCSAVSVAHIKETIASCYEQNEITFSDCEKHAFIFVTVNNTQYCVDPGSKWLKRRFQILVKRRICCQML